MKDHAVPVVALGGNPNSGKTSLFNLLAHTTHKVGNFPGVTVERISSTVELPEVGKVRLVDLPGTYSLFPNAADERIATEVLINPQHPDHPDLVVYVADANHLNSQLLALSQIIDLKMPTLLVLSLMDEFEKSGRSVDLARVGEALGIPVVPISSRKRTNIESLRQKVAEMLQSHVTPQKQIHRLHVDAEAMLEDIGQIEPEPNKYMRWLWTHHQHWLPFDTGHHPEEWDRIYQDHHFEPLKEQVEETFARLNGLEALTEKVIRRDPARMKATEKWDAVLTHWLWGPLIFSVMMLFVFQAIFAWATYPMDWIEAFFGSLGGYLTEVMAAGWFTDLITKGLIPGLSGVLIFVPQIAILFFLITLLEEIGYMARAVYLFDRFLQRYGMNGRSIVALISGGACAIPAVMATRTIVNWKERLITILVTPFISCSARIPVYTVLVAFVVPYESVLGVFNSQGLAFAGLYLLGIVAALGSGWIFKKILKSRIQSYFVMELPNYRMPDWQNVWRNVRSKVGSFITEAGKIILLISLVLWVLASYGPPSQMQEAEEAAMQQAQEQSLDEDATNDLLASKKLEASFAGILGRQIEPIMEPLGYDWKISIGLLTAFAAREVFIGSMATIYSVGSEEDEFKIREHLAKQIDPETGQPIFNYATALSLLLFFVFAMQCMSTLAVVKKETKSWKWPAVQMIFMTATAYLSALAAYQYFS